MNALLLLENVIQRARPDQTRDDAFANPVYIGGLNAHAFAGREAMKQHLKSFSAESVKEGGFHYEVRQS